MPFLCLNSAVFGFYGFYLCPKLARSKWRSRTTDTLWFWFPQHFFGTLRNRNRNRRVQFHRLLLSPHKPPKSLKPSGYFGLSAVGFFFFFFPPFLSFHFLPLPCGRFGLSYIVNPCPHHPSLGTIDWPKGLLQIPHYPAHRFARLTDRHTGAATTRVHILFEQ